MREQASQNTVASWSLRGKIQLLGQGGGRRWAKGWTLSGHSKSWREGGRASPQGGCSKPHLTCRPKNQHPRRPANSVTNHTGRKWKRCRCANRLKAFASFDPAISLLKIRTNERSTQRNIHGDVHCSVIYPSGPREAMWESHRGGLVT